MIKFIKNIFKKKEKPYWSYQGYRMVANEEAIERTKEESLKTYNDFISGDFELEDILSGVEFDE